MINYKGIDLDINDKVLQSFVVSGGLTKVESLQARTGIKSVEFSIPITAKNQLAFSNINTEGAQSEAFGDSYIKIDNNIYQKGTLYVRGYANENFKVLFVGSFNKLMDNLSRKKLSELFNYDYQWTFTHANAIVALESGISQSLNTGVSFNLGHPNLIELNTANQVEFNKLGFFFSVRHIINKILWDEGISLSSEFMDSDYGLNLRYSSFTEAHLSSNTWTDTSNQIDNAKLDIATPLANNGSVVKVTGNNYEFRNSNTDKVNVKANLEFTNNGDLEDCKVWIAIWRPDLITPPPFNIPTLLYASRPMIDTINGFLQQGSNYIDLDIDVQVQLYDWIEFHIEPTFKSGFSAPSISSLYCDYLMISHDNVQDSDAIYLGNEVGDITQFDFLKGFLVDNNLVLDINGDEARMELQDEGYTPFIYESLPSIRDKELDISALVERETDVTLDYLQAGTIYLKQKLLTAVSLDKFKILDKQEFGSYLYELNTFQKRNIETYESYFNAAWSYLDNALLPATEGGSLESWDNIIVVLNGYYGGIYQETKAVNYQTTPSPTAIDAIITWSRYYMFISKWKGFFKATFDQKKNNKIIEIRFKDQNGTIINNRTTYIINNQKYKMIDWSYDLITKQAQANLTLL